MGIRYKIVEVNDRKSKKEFIMLPVRLYRNDKSYIRPLDMDIERIFDPKKNKYFRHGVCTRWILLDEAAFLLFEQCKEWLAKKGMEAMDGPVNFGERHQWWGLLIEGFTEPNYCMPYNFDYYRELFEAYGFQEYFKQYTYHRAVKDGLQDVVKNKADKVLQNPYYTFRHHDKSRMLKFTEDFRNVYNKGWARHTGVAQMSSVQARALFKKLKPILDEKLLWFAYYKEHPVAFFLILPELNQIYKYLNGKFHLLNKLRFLILKRRGVCKKMLGTIFGVVPEHQGKGVESAIVVAFSKVAWADDFPYEELEMNWIGDFNPKMMHVAEQMGGKIYKIHHTYRYLFDRQKEFHRAPVID